MPIDLDIPPEDLALHREAFWRYNSFKRLSRPYTQIWQNASHAKTHPLFPASCTLHSRTGGAYL
jgi:hypothetical protein